MELPGRTRQQAASYYSTVDFDVLGPVRVLREGVPVYLKGPNSAPFSLFWSHTPVEAPRPTN